MRSYNTERLGINLRYVYTIVQHLLKHSARVSQKIKELIAKNDRGTGDRQYQMMLKILAKYLTIANLIDTTLYTELTLVLNELFTGIKETSVD